jgi:hypothetical protein
MRRVVLSLVLAAGLAASGSASAFAADPASAAPATKPAKPAKLAKDDPNRMVCTREHLVGSNRPEKVCMTVGERQRLKDAASRTLDESRRPGQQSPGETPSGG